MAVCTIALTAAQMMSLPGRSKFAWPRTLIEIAPAPRLTLIRINGQYFGLRYVRGDRCLAAVRGFFGCAR